MAGPGSQRALQPVGRGPRGVLVGWGQEKRTQVTSRLGLERQPEGGAVSCNVGRLRGGEMKTFFNALTLKCPLHHQVSW